MLGEHDEGKFDSKEQFESGLELYFAKDFAEASVRFSDITKDNPDDRVARIYLERSAEYMVHGVPDNWEG